MIQAPGVNFINQFAQCTKAQSKASYQHFSGLYYKHITIVIDAASVVSK
jgi:hypothetical protein